jgi:hypothetical protein
MERWIGSFSGFWNWMKDSKGAFEAL